MKIYVRNYVVDGLTVWLENGEYILPLGEHGLEVADPYDSNSTEIMYEVDETWNYATVQSGGAAQLMVGGYEVQPPQAATENTLVAKDLLLEGFGLGAVTAGTMMIFMIVKKVLRQGPAYD